MPRHEIDGRAGGQGFGLRVAIDLMVREGMIDVFDYRLFLMVLGFEPPVSREDTLHFWRIFAVGKMDWLVDFPSRSVGRSN